MPVQVASHQMQHRLLGFLEEHRIVWKGAFDLVPFPPPYARGPSAPPPDKLFTLKMSGLGLIAEKIEVNVQ